MPKAHQVIGHAGLQQELLQDLECNNVSHAYLLSGPRHIGKMAVAHWFARNLLLQGIQEESLEAKKRSIDHLTHPDLLVLDQLWIEDVCEDWDIISHSSNVHQDLRAKKKVKTDIISIDDIREFQERLYETGTGKWRCCIIRSVERMQVAAANAFLKILEEPPEGLVFILTTQAYSKLLPTLISRARVMRMYRLPHAELLPLLEGVPQEDRQFLLHIAQGAPGVLLNLKENPDALREQKLLHSKALSFWKETSVRERMQMLKPLHKRGTESDRFLFHLALALREREASPKKVQALSQLCRGLETNAHRQLLSQQFALHV